MAKSFFEKLTGSLSEEDQEQYEYEEPTEVLGGEGDDFDDEEEEEIIDNEEEEDEDDDEVEEEIEDEEPDVKTDVAMAAKTITRKPRKKVSTPEHQESEGQLAIDVYETSDEIVIKSTIAGVDPKDLDVSITSDTVTVRGTRQKDEHIESSNYFYQECYWGTFSRSVILPVEIDSENAKASFKNGVLSIRLPKIVKNRERKLRITDV